jgi:anti-anti-sigma factor
MPSIPRFSLSVATEASGLTVGIFPAEVDVSNASAIRDRLLGLLDSGAGPLVLDLAETRFCDCAGVGAIIGVEQRAIAWRTRICLVLPPDGTVRRIAEITGLTRRLTVTTSLSSAREALDRPCRGEADAVPC